MGFLRAAKGNDDAAMAIIACNVSLYPTNVP